MPTLAAPSFLLGAALAAGVVVALHLLAWRRPSPRPLPTARFAPASSARAVSRAVQLRDVALLLVRVAVLLLAGLALARPSWSAPRRGVARVLVLDASRRVASARAVADSARAAASGAATVVRIRVDSAAHRLADSALGDVAPVRGTLGAGLIAAVREGRWLARTHARVELVVISPFAVESWDESMEAVRERWGGPVRAIRVAAITDTSAAPEGANAPGVANGVSGLPSLRDPVDAALALALHGGVGARRRVHVARDALTAADSAVARAGGVVIAWPRATLPDSAFVPRVLTLGNRATIGRFATGVPATLPSGHPFARWGDGTAAAVEAAVGAGCIRTVAVALPASGDAALSHSLRAALRALAAPCGGGTAAVIDNARLAEWATPRGGATTRARDTDRASASPPPRGSDAQRWLLVAVAVLLAVEWWMRRQRAASAGATPRPGAVVPEAA